MDLSTVARKLLDGKYHFVEDFRKDIILMFENCSEYNLPNSDIVEASKQLEARFTKYFRKIDFVALLSKEQRTQYDVASGRNRNERGDASSAPTHLKPSSTPLPPNLAAQLSQHNLLGAGPREMVPTNSHSQPHPISSQKPAPMSSPSSHQNSLTASLPPMIPGPGAQNGFNSPPLYYMPVMYPPQQPGLPQVQYVAPGGNPSQRWPSYPPLQQPFMFTGAPFNPQYQFATQAPQQPQWAQPPSVYPNNAMSIIPPQFPSLPGGGGAGMGFSTTSPGIPNGNHLPEPPVLPPLRFPQEMPAPAESPFLPSEATEQRANTMSMYTQPPPPASQH